MRAPLPALAALAALALGACARPLKLGLSLELTGRFSEPGVAVRNGAQLAAEELRAEGRRIELLVEDDGGDAEGARRADGRLLAAGCRLVVGHVTSALSLAALEGPAAAELLYLSPTANAAALSGRDDGFFMLLPTAAEEGRSLAAELSRRGSRSAVLVLDAANAAFAESFGEAFAGAFEAAGGRVAEPLRFAGRPGAAEPAAMDHQDLVARALLPGPEAIVLATGVLDAALLAQGLRKAGYRGLLASSDWAMAPELAESGGAAAEGMLFAYLFDETEPSPRARAFINTYRARHGAEPGFAAWLGWEAVMVLAEAARGGGDPARVKKSLLAGGYQGLAGAIAFDPDGDARRELLLFELRAGRFERAP